MRKHGRKMTQVHLSPEAREALERIHAIFDGADESPAITNASAVTIALRVWANILDPNEDCSLYSDENLTEILEAKCFMIVCESLARVIEICELVDAPWGLTGDPETKEITITVGEQKLVLTPPVAAAETVPAFKHTNRVH